MNHSSRDARPGTVPGPLERKSGRRPSRRPGMIAPRHDIIELAGIEVSCIVGMYPPERHALQSLIVDVWLYLDTRRAAATDSLRDTVDYARLSGEIRFLLESCRFRLLETAADALCRYILAPATPDRPRPPVAAAMVKVTKPEALGGGGCPALTVWRSADEVRLESEVKPFGRVDIIHVSPGCGIYRLRVLPGRSIRTHLHRRMEESELILGEGLLLQGQPVRPGLAFRWPRELPHRYDNPSSSEQSILCVDRPAFIPEDEIEVDEPMAGLILPPPLSYYPDGDRGLEAGTGVHGLEESEHSPVVPHPGARVSHSRRTGEGA